MILKLKIRFVKIALKSIPIKLEDDSLILQAPIHLQPPVKLEKNKMLALVGYIRITKHFACTAILRIFQKDYK